MIRWPHQKTGVLRGSRFFLPDDCPDITTIPCGSEPARDSGVTETWMLADTTPSRAGSLPQGRVVFFRG
ncbi:hypothetical protein C1X35_01435 [Pseudomonas sp. FW306-1C-G01A]|nr:hypothetical protein C1X56_00215 [Pseudomonas sp. GW101-1A09]PMV91867.1 hypothetical protein C1X51_20135 [Pseudomonas sp. FW306-2-2C-B10A]PMV94737.1 hypothetical protein C1X55_23610 [Pseudomonas sp. GW460-C8]PMW07210.1 hypothetical protein C1X50_05920 [Pseudomonas sp. MPR-TSA4]PMW10599.1 hypothetical protein C1X52_23045 [Pseudomonas sp. FW306-2-1A-C05A]PMW13028.1 hypothetical protein C1X40_25320 [Pseudomonas sp. GW456-11-11-14-TSB2]PMW25159.1 hypothetical protein C1X53_08305 [Pseudomonas s